MKSNKQGTDDKDIPDFVRKGVFIHMFSTVVKLLVIMGSLILNIGILRNSYEYLGLLIGTKIPAFHWVINSGLWSLNIMWPVLTLYL